MIDSASLIIFIGAALVLLVVPGPAVLYIVARSIDQGAFAGIVSVLGIGLGSLIHVFAAALGLSALLVSSALAFMIVKYLGAAYLVYLGVSTLLKKSTTVETEKPQQQSLFQIFRQGVIVNVLNPKTALFFFAFLPQFVDADRGLVSTQILLLGAIFTAMAIFTDGIYALLSGHLGQWLKQNEQFLKLQRYLSGGMYIVLGVTTALSGSDN
jgi:threonine/homoserine/homoserine lactone efflux protein